MAGVGQPAGDGERGTDGCVRGPHDTGRHPPGSALVSRLAYSDAYTLPITATPRVPPNRRVASLTADPTPAFAFGTTPMIASVAGALGRPIPVPRTTIWAAIVP